MIDQRWIQAQTTKLAMTGQMHQSLNILQLPAADLIDYLNQQALENPVLEIRFPEWRGGRRTVVSQARDNRFNEELWVTAPDSDSLEKELLMQLNCLREVTDLVRSVTKYIIGNLNPDGYLSLTVEQMASELGVSCSLAEQALSLLQSFDPPGVGARNVRECLLLQLERANARHKLAYRMADDCLELVAEAKWMQIAKLLKESVADVKKAASELARLNPRPSATHYDKNGSYIVPDLVIDKVDAKLAIRNHDICYPHLNIDECYAAMMTNRHATPSEKEFLKPHILSAKRLIQCLSKRRETLIRVMVEIASRQTAFFHHGKGHLSPLTLKDVAHCLDLHESTVSRTVSGKYVLTQWGTFELKYFFVSAPQGQENASSERIKEQIKKWVSVESNPHSDKELAARLQEEGVTISRRTIAKYRSQLGIHGSAKRNRG